MNVYKPLAAIFAVTLASCDSHRSVDAIVAQIKRNDYSDIDKLLIAGDPKQVEAIAYASVEALNDSSFLRLCYVAGVRWNGEHLALAGLAERMKEPYRTRFQRFLESLRASK